MPTEASMMIRIRDGMDALTPVNARIAAYVLQNPQQVVRMSIRALAQASEASDAAVMRFCKAIG
ncbi:MAG: RpiR family transcriptional regulator, partial [Clostridia bacterium]|nr:RpiR family transcriptional regulator [Clostridia bacterium]